MWPPSPSACGWRAPPSPSRSSGYGDPGFTERAARSAVSVGLLNGQPLNHWKAEKASEPLKRLAIHGIAGLDLSREVAVAEGSQLTRELTWLPPNLLTPGSYRKRIRALAKDAGWSIEEYDLGKLEKLGAGAFLAVARGSPKRDAAIVHLTYDGTPKRGKGQALALVGKGICFDTGGMNLKSAKHMHGMHEDMAGSAVALGTLLALTRLKAAVPDRLLAGAGAEPHRPARLQAERRRHRLQRHHHRGHPHRRRGPHGARRHARPRKPGEAAPDHRLCDAHRRLRLCPRHLLQRYPSPTATRSSPRSSRRAATAASASGPSPSTRITTRRWRAVADIKQCTLEGEADHILAARFLKRFVADRPWLHIDLSASRCKGGLGAVGTDITGFGVGLGVELLAPREASR
jgi:leucyl aminopeptidase